MKKNFFSQSAPIPPKSDAIDMVSLSPIHHQNNGSKKDGHSSVPVELSQFARDRRRQRSVSTNTVTQTVGKDEDLFDEDGVFPKFTD